MSHLPRFWPFPGLLAALLLPAVAWATVILKVPFEGWVSHAPLIVRGTVVAQQVQGDLAANRIDTLTEVRVTEVLKGKAASTVLVRQPGGTYRDVEQRVAGAARFEEGEDVVLFLEPAADDRTVHVVLGMAAGKYRLQKAPTGELRATQELDGLSAYTTLTTGESEVTPLKGQDHGEAEAFLARIRKLVRGGSR